MAEIPIVIKKNILKIVNQKGRCIEIYFECLFMIV